MTIVPERLEVELSSLAACEPWEWARLKPASPHGITLEQLLGGVPHAEFDVNECLATTMAQKRFPDRASPTADKCYSFGRTRSKKAVEASIKINMQVC